MAGQPSEWLRRAAEILADGEWHDYDKVVREAALAVPPGRALRRNEAIRLRFKRRPGEHLIGDHRRVNRTDEQRIEYGARAIAAAALSGSVLFEIEPRGAKVRDATKRIRLVPGKQLWKESDG